MLNIKHILFPIDFSERCCGAVPFVESMASRYEAKVTLLSVAAPFYYGVGDPGGPVVVNAEEMVQELQARLDMSLRTDFAGLQVERVAEVGDPAQAITDYADRHRVGLIMMPTHGYGPFRSLLLGSVTAKVLHDASCPVWTAAHVGEPPCRFHVACRRMICAVDATPSSVPLVKWASELCKDTGATLRLVHAITGMEGVQSRRMEGEYVLEEEMRNDARLKLEQVQEAAGTSVPACVVVGNVAEGVREEARRHEADLVVIGRGGIHETLGRLRTHAHAIIRRSPCPVLSV